MAKSLMSVIEGGCKRSTWRYIEASEHVFFLQLSSPFQSTLLALLTTVASFCASARLPPRARSSLRCVGTRTRCGRRPAKRRLAGTSACSIRIGGRSCAHGGAWATSCSCRPKKRAQHGLGTRGTAVTGASACAACTGSYTRGDVAGVAQTLCIAESAASVATGMMGVTGIVVAAINECPRVDTQPYVPQLVPARIFTSHSGRLYNLTKPVLGYVKI